MQTALTTALRTADGWGLSWDLHLAVSKADQKGLQSESLTADPRASQMVAWLAHVTVERKGRRWAASPAADLGVHSAVWLAAEKVREWVVDLVPLTECR